MTRYLRALALGAAMIFAAAPAFAHSTVKGTDPVSGSVLPASPEVVTITFNEAAKVTSVVVVEAGKPERQLDVMSGSDGKFYMMHEPKLANGRNEIKWKALSKDGHPILGSIIIVIKPGATPSSPKPATEHHDH